jgi:FKBP-type peptidyl-prolyl cis-trans isomerase (trigger factor)
MTLYKIGGRDVDLESEEAKIVSKFVLFRGDNATTENIDRQIQQFKDRNGASTPHQFVHWINQHAQQLRARILNDPVISHELEHTTKNAEADTT